MLKINIEVFNDLEWLIECQNTTDRFENGDYTINGNLYTYDLTIEDDDIIINSMTRKNNNIQEDN